MRAAIFSIFVAAISMAGSALAQQPPARGPYLFVSDDDGVMVLIALGDRSASTAAPAATSVTMLNVNDAPVRVDGVIEADCARGVRRTQALYIFNGHAPDDNSTVLFTAPGVAWSLWGPADGPIRDLLCNNEHDPARVRPRVSDHVGRWSGR